MAAYGSIDTAKAGMIDGLIYEIESLTVQDGETFDFGDPVFVQEGDEVNAHQGDNGSFDLVFAGIAVISQRSFVDNEGDYPEYDRLNCLSKGRAWAKVVSGLSGIANQAAYVVDDATSDDYGLFTNVDTNYPTGGFFRSEPVEVGDDELAIVEVRGLYDGTPNT